MTWLLQCSPNRSGDRCYKEKHFPGDAQIHAESHSETQGKNTAGNHRLSRRDKQGLRLSEVAAPGIPVVRLR